MPKTENINTNPILSFLTQKRWLYVRHFLLILVTALVYNLLSPESMAMYAEKVNVPFKVFYIGQFIDMIFSLGLIYFNLYYLFPRYFKKGLYTHYLMGVLFTAVLFFLISYVIQQIYVAYFGKIDKYAVQFTLEDFIGSVVFPIVFLCATTGYKVFKEWIADQERFTTLEKEKLNTELNQLKNQVNPHFLFNTLNNLHVLIQADPHKASDIVLGLSDVLRYQIYDSQHDKVPLAKDVEIIEQYLELEKIRRDNLTVNIAINGNINNVFVPPLLFTNFIDNAIKHSQSREPSYINLLFEVVDKYVYFKIVNSKPSLKNQEENSGFGLENVKKRLNLLYADTHTLDIKEEKNSFSVKLKFPI
jgi:two-component system, LytTR family, sensor kinase